MMHFRAQDEKARALRHCSLFAGATLTYCLTYYSNLLSGNMHQNVPGDGVNPPCEIPCHTTSDTRHRGKSQRLPMTNCLLSCQRVQLTLLVF